MKFKLIISLFTALIAGSLPMWSQMTATDAFKSAPQSVFPLLDKNTRLDMLDYFSAGMAHESVNALDGGSAVTALSPESVTMKMTDASVVQLFVVPAKNDTVVGVITTVATPAQDSSLKLYNSKWAPMTMKSVFQAPALVDWLKDSSKLSDVEFAVPFMLVGYNYDPATQTLTLINNLKGFLPDEVYSTISPLMYDQLMYKWNGSRFTAVK